MGRPTSGTMYIRVKRERTTIFLHVDPSDNILQVKHQISKLTQQASLSPELKGAEKSHRLDLACERQQDVKGHHAAGLPKMQAALSISDIQVARWSPGMPDIEGSNVSLDATSVMAKECTHGPTSPSKIRSQHSCQAGRLRICRCHAWSCPQRMLTRLFSDLPHGAPHTQGFKHTK